MSCGEQGEGRGEQGKFPVRSQHEGTSARQVAQFLDIRSREDTKLNETLETLGE